MADNWYLVLGLEFDPNPVQDQAKIDEKIDEMQKFWARNVNHMTRGAEYKKYMQLIPDIRKAMSDQNERTRMIKEACGITFDAVDKMLKLMRKAEVSNDEVSKLAVKLKVSEEIVKRRATALGMKVVVAKSADFQNLYDKYYKTKPQDAQKFDGMEPLLKTFHADNLYAFLFANTTMKNPANLPCDALRQRASEKKKTEYIRPNDDIHSSGRKLCDHCDLTFKNEVAKDTYDRFLEYSKRKAILDSVKSIADISGEISPEQGEEFIGRLTELFKNRKLASEVLLAFCKIEKISYNPASSPSKTAAMLKVCRCGCTNDVSDGRKVCQSCGADLYIKCPKCGVVSDAHVKVCKCGFSLDNINKVMALCNLAEIAIDTMDFTVAQARLADAEHYWPGSDRVKSLVRHLSDRKKQVGTAVDAMRKAVSEKRYYEAQKHLSDIKKMFPDFSEPDLEKEIKVATETADKLLKQARASKNDVDVIELCSKAYEVCADYPGIGEMISKYPPQAPANLKVSADGNARTNSLSWDKSSTTGSVFYTVVRKSNAAPVNVSDGTVLGRISMCGFNDRNILPAENYYYAVFAERAGVFSSALVSRIPTINLFEIVNVTIAAGNTLLQLEWAALPHGASVEIYRKTGSGAEQKIASTTAVSYLDSGLSNDTLYQYTLRLIYNVNGQQQYTKGVSVTGIPTKPPRAIDTLSVKPGDGDSFAAVWSNPDNLDVELYCSTERPEYNFGDLIAQSTLEVKMRRLALNRSSNGSAVFQYKGDELLYIAAVVIKSGSAIFGTLARASKGETVKIKRIAAVNEKINIYLDAPPGATGFVVLYRFDKFPEDISDVKTVRKYIPLKQYQYYSALVLDTLEQKNYFFSVFAEFMRDGEKDYSIGADYLFLNTPKEIITYSITVSRKLFGESSVLLEFEAENRSFVLPGLDIMSSTGSTPMFKIAAKPFHAIPSQQVNGILQVRIPLPKGLPGDTFIKAFLADESQASSVQLKLKLKSSYQIS